jgi:outer membrane immunogenic protein
VQVGYNWQPMSNWIFSIEADFQASGENATGNVHQNALKSITQSIGVTSTASIVNSLSISHNDSLLWFGTVRGRIGYAIWPTLMLYGTGGLAYGRLNESVAASSNLSAACSSPCTAILILGANAKLLPIAASGAFDASVTKTGWTVGGGIEGAVPNTHVTWKAEYLYMDLGSESYTFSGSGFGINVNTHFTDNIVRVGLNYQFH